MKRRTALLLCLLMMMTTVFTGCGEETLFDAENPVTVTVWNYYSGNQLDAFDTLVSEFNSTVGKEKGIIVKSKSFGSIDDLQDNLLAAAKGDVGAEEVPDIFMAYADIAYAMDQMGKVVDLSSYFTEEEIASYVEGYIKEGDFNRNGELKILPIAKSTEVMIMNKTDWNKFAGATGASYDDISTIEGLTATAEKYYNWTDSLTPGISNDGKALFGRDAVANFLLVGSVQQGHDMFVVEDGHMTLDFDKSAIRNIWDNYYVPFIKGHFAATGRFRSDDIKTGNIISYVGSSSGVSFFPESVSISDTENYRIEMDILPAPGFKNGQKFAAQQGAGVSVATSTEAEVVASVEFLKWFTQPEQNIGFCVDAGYLPVTVEANDADRILAEEKSISDAVEMNLLVSVDTINNNTIYTTAAFEGATDARKLLEYNISDLAIADRKVVVEKLAAGESLAKATESYCSDEYFEQWYTNMLEALKVYEK